MCERNQAQVGNRLATGIGDTGGMACFEWHKPLSGGDIIATTCWLPSLGATHIVTSSPLHHV